MFDFNIVNILYRIPGIILGFSIHELGHAIAADRLGDPTPRQQGKLTLDPRKHIDPIGFIMLMLFSFGWAKPVMTNPRYYKHPRRDDIIVSVAGPLSNLGMAIVFAGLLKLFIMTPLPGMLGQNTTTNIINLILVTLSINVSLFIFNLLPLPPLDGFHVLSSLLPPRYYRQLGVLYQYSTIILIVLLVTNAFDYILGIPFRGIIWLISLMFNLPL